ncbi:hypothetical protein MAL1_00012 [Bacteriophage DSS3_MAL1]|nr:hypothetical protein MAL1_00012 [Bacteriophage DSS3_MAL1]
MGAKPCPRGHPPIRRRKGTKDATVCYKCHREERTEWNKKWAKTNPEAAAAASRRQRAANPERRRAQEREWRARNRAKCKAKKMRHIAALEMATPTWLTDDQWEQMNVTYEERDRITAETGVQHHVDHIVPLRGESVCGLHVPWNLRVISAEHNTRKGNKWSSEGVSAVDEAVLGDIAA